MYEGRPLHEIGWEDLKAFLEEGRPEGTRLDYKRKWGQDVARDACAMANTSGGDLILGVKEVEDKRAKTHAPDAEDIPGEDASRDWKTVIEGKVRGRTRPPVVVEAKALPIGDDPARAVVVVRVEESPDSPHEVYASSDPEIPVRRGANTVSAGLDDVERMIARREASRVPREPLMPDFFEGLLVPEPSYDRGMRGNPPTLAVAVRPRRASFAFPFDADLDRILQHLSIENYLTDDRLLRPERGGMAFQDPPSDTPRTRVEVRKDATIFCAWALDVAKPEHPGDARPLDFWALTRPALSAVRFAGAAYAERRPGTEMEVMIGLSGCQGCRVLVGTHPPKRPGEIPNHGFYRQPEFAGVVVKTDHDSGEPSTDDLVGLIRELSRFFGVSVSDHELSEYV